MTLMLPETGSWLRFRWSGGACGLIVALSLGLAPAAVGADADAVARQIQARVAELEALRAEVRAERSQRQAERDALAEQVDRLEADLRSAESAAAALGKQVGELRAARGEAAAEREQVAGALATVAAAVGEALAGLHERIGQGVTAGREQRLAAVERIGEGLNADDAAARVEALGTFVDFAGEELQRVDQRELRNERVAVGDRQKHAFIYRLGLVAEGFASEDGTVKGLFDPRQGGWRVDVGEDGARVQRVIDTMRERRPPAVIAVPMVGAVLGEQAGGDE